MGRVYDNWGKLVEAVARRELLMKLSLQSEPPTPSTRSFDSDFSSSTSSYRYNNNAYFIPSPSPLHPDDLRLKLEQITKDGGPDVSATVPTKRSNLWKVLFIFRRLLSSNKENGKEERKPKWANGKRAFHGHEPVKSYSMGNNSQVAEEAKRKSELERLKELYTLKGHIEALVRAKVLDGDSFNHYYTV